MTSHHNPPIRLILDQSALLAYAAGSVHVAEPIHEVANEGGYIGVPVVVAATALHAIRDGSERAALHWLYNQDLCAIVPLDESDWLELSFWLGYTDRPDIASVMKAAEDHRAWILTAEPKAYSDGIPLIEIPT